jgi:N-acetylglucosaminyldiphosphoundecaprenol N-acetyl-beta-D-mannosaminyltransferase
MNRDLVNILGIQTDVLTREGAVSAVREWCGDQSGRYICLTNVHMCMEAHDSPAVREAVNGADRALADGKPIAFLQRWVSGGRCEQIRGHDFMMDVLEMASSEGFVVSFYGSTSETLGALRRRLLAAYPALKLGTCIAPEFGEIKSSDVQADIKEFTAQGTDILFVGLGCPKQEQWMHRFSSTTNFTMVGVGAAFDFGAGIKPMAPDIMQKVGLEWLFRLASEPRRLWKRYLYNNPRFLALAIRTWLRGELRRKNEPS